MAEENEQKKAVAKNGAFRISFDAWLTAGDLREWMDAANAMNMKALYRKLAQVVKSWPFDGDPADVESYDKLSLDEFGKVFGKVRNDVTDFFLEKVGADQ